MSGTDGFDETVESAWREFRGALADRLDDLDESEVVEPFVAVNDEGTGGPFVRVDRTSDALIIQVPGNRLLAPRQRRTRTELHRLRRLGLRPTSARTFYLLEVPATYADQAASIVVATFRSVFAVVHPVFLTCPEVTGETTDETAAVAAVMPTDQAHLDGLVDEALTTMFGHTPNRDSDGDVPIRTGDGIVFVCTDDSAQWVRLLSPVVVDIHDTEAAAETVAGLNRDLAGMKFTLEEHQMIAAVDVPAMPFSADQLRLLVHQLCKLIASRGGELAAQLDGHTFAEEARRHDLE
ncbi:T3SS (YopN, CesT) and YbjN peptide-binding chaperone 1 [Propionibacteriaceae bacterium Y2011]